MNLQKMQMVLSMAPLCSATFISKGKDGHRYCALGALARYAGLSNEAIEDAQDGGIKSSEALNAMWRALEREYDFPRGFNFLAIAARNDNAMPAMRKESVMEFLTGCDPRRTVEHGTITEQSSEEGSQSGAPNGASDPQATAQADAGGPGGCSTGWAQDGISVGSTTDIAGAYESAVGGHSAAAALG